MFCGGGFVGVVGVGRCGVGDEPGDAVFDVDVPLFCVDQVVVVGAEEDAVVGAGGSALGPVGDVVGFAPGCGDGAVGEGAALVAGVEGFADVGWEDAGGAADVEDASLAAEEDGDDVGVAGDFADGGGGDGAGVGEGSAAGGRAGRFVGGFAERGEGVGAGPVGAGRVDAGEVGGGAVACRGVGFDGLLGVCAGVRFGPGFAGLPGAWQERGAAGRPRVCGVLPRVRGGVRLGLGFWWRGVGLGSVVAGAAGGGGLDAVEEVAVADGDHDLGAESSGGGQGAGGEGCFGRADEAVEALLGGGAAVGVGEWGGGVEGRVG